MPVKWTADKDSFILNHLLVDPRIKIDNAVIDAMIATWPESFGDKPTRKAFTEHFSKVRKANKSLVATGNGDSSPATPNTTRTTKKKTPATKTPLKRKRNVTSDSDADPDDEEVAREHAERKDDWVKVKAEPVEETGLTKKFRRVREEGKYAESDGEGEDHPSSGDDYQAEPEVEA